MSTRRTDTDQPASTVATAPGDTADAGITIIADDPAAPTWRRRLRTSRDRLSAVLAPLWRDWRIGTAAAIGGAALWAAIAGWWTPRGPLTTSQAIWSIILSLAVGVVAGLVMRSRWAMLAAPVTFAAVFELVRLAADGPTVDGIGTSFYGLLALGSGRGFHALLSLLPLAFGAVLGAGIARRLAASTLAPPSPTRPPGRPWWLYVRRGAAVVAGLGLIAFTVALARPASTDPIVDAHGREIAGSIAELTTIDVRGHDLHLMIRGHSIDNPVLLFLAGGPGGSEMGAMRRHLPELEEHFTVVTWDQRGAGKSYDELDPTGTYTLESAVDDVIAVTNHLRDRFGQDKIYLLGQSWGTTLGVLAVQQQPDLFEAYIGTGQMVSQLATDTLFYDDTLDWARANDNTDLVDELTRIGPPPYDRMLNYETALANEQAVYPYDHSSNAEGEAQMSENLIVEEYTLIDQVHVLGAFMDTFSVLYPQLQGIDFRAHGE